MLSIIICSRQKDITQSLKNNIKETIGVDYELIVIDNSTNKFSIFTAYNEGISRAKGEILCFMHEDILFHTLEWGKKIKNHFVDKKVGLVGVIGGHVIMNYPSTWCCTNLISGNYIQGYTDKNGNYDNTLVINDNYLNNELTDVVAVDGFWFCVKYEIFEKIRFDDQTFSGFHAYDIDICMQIHLIGKRVCVIDDVKIEHFSFGTPDDRWLHSMILFQKKWKQYLPIVEGITLSKFETREIRHKLKKKYANRIKKMNKYRILNFIFFRNKNSYAPF